LAPTNQIHDFSPGNVPGGLFWTIPIPDKSVEVNLAEAKASMVVSKVGTRDFFNIPNNLTHGKSIHANVSFHIHWHGVKQRVHLHDKENHFDARMIEDSATIRWSAHEKDFSFVSDPEETSTTVFAEIGRERNGVFF
jgi:hypothetical protein